VTHRVAIAIFRELLEVGSFTALLVRLDPDLLQPAVAGQPRVARNLREIRVDRRTSSFPSRSKSSQQPHCERSRNCAAENFASPLRVGVTS